MLAYCPECGCNRNLQQVERENTYPVKGEPITITAQVMICDACRAEVYYDELDEKNLELAYEKYRLKHDLLGPADISDLRGKYGLSQRGLGALLGWSPSTIARYEAGAIPERAHNEQLKRFRDDVSYRMELYTREKCKLNGLESKRMEQALGGCTEEQSACAELLKPIVNSIYSKHSEICRGNRDFDFDKFANMIVFFANECSRLVKSKLLKLLWYSDFGYYKRYTLSMSGAVYCHHYYGPIPDHHNMLLAYLDELGVVEFRPYSGPYGGDYVYPTLSFEADLFEKEELDVLREVVRCFRYNTAKEMTSISHQEEPYKQTDLHEPIPYSLARELKGI